MKKLYMLAVELIMLAGLSTAALAAGETAPNVAVVPEPSGIIVSLMGLGSLVGYIRLRKK